MVKKSFRNLSEQVPIHCGLLIPILEHFFLIYYVREIDLRLSN